MRPMYRGCLAVRDDFAKLEDEFTNQNVRDAEARLLAMSELQTSDLRVKDGW